MWFSRWPEFDAAPRCSLSGEPRGRRSSMRPGLHQANPGNVRFALTRES